MTARTYSEAGTYARVPLGEAFDVLERELDDLINRVCRPPADLWLDYDPHIAALPWVVKDGAFRDELMFRFPTVEAALGWARVFVARTLGAKLDVVTFETALASSGEGPGRVPGRIAADPKAGRPPVSLPVPHDEVAPSPDEYNVKVPSNVVPIRKDVA